MKGFRTIFVNSAVAAIPLAAELLSFLDVFDWRSVAPEYAGWFILVVGVLNIGLRFITTTPVGKKD